jgi:hypothetical protein
MATETSITLWWEFVKQTTVCVDSHVMEAPRGRYSEARDDGASNISSPILPPLPWYSGSGSRGQGGPSTKREKNRAHINLTHTPRQLLFKYLCSISMETGSNIDKTSVQQLVSPCSLQQCHHCRKRMWDSHDKFTKQICDIKSLYIDLPHVTLRCVADCSEVLVGAQVNWWRLSVTTHTEWQMRWVDSGY